MTMTNHEIVDLNHARAIREYLADGDDCTFWHALATLGFDRDEIQLHVDNPGWRMPQGFA